MINSLIKTAISPKGAFPTSRE